MSEQTQEKVELDYKMQYEDFINEKGLDPNKFPPAIGKRIRTIKMFVGKYNANPSEQMKQNIIKEDIATANLIMSWVEQDYPDEIVDPSPIVEEVVEETPPAEGGDTPPAPDAEGGEAPAQPAAEGDETPPAPPVEPVKTEEELAAEKAAEEAKAEEERKAQVLAEMERKIMDNIKGNRIKSHVLEQIIGQKPDSSVQKVGKLTLKKVYLFDGYELI